MSEFLSSFFLAFCVVVSVTIFGMTLGLSFQSHYHLLEIGLNSSCKFSGRDEHRPAGIVHYVIQN